MEDGSPGLREKFQSLQEMLTYRPKLTAGLFGLSVLTALFEGIGITFIIPIIELAGQGPGAQDPSSQVEIFVTVYRILGVPFELRYLIGGALLVLALRYVLSYLFSVVRAIYKADYVRKIQTDAYEATLRTEVSYFDNEGSDRILNVIIKQSTKVENLAGQLPNVIKLAALMVIYLCVAVYVAPRLTAVLLVIFAVFGVGARRLISPSYDIGNEVAEANEDIQKAAQDGVQGIRDVKLFRMGGEMRKGFQAAVDRYVDAFVRLQRNRALLDNVYQFTMAVALFGFLYVAIAFLSLSLSSLGAFLFALFRLSPRASRLNDLIYAVDGNLPHLVRTQQFIAELEGHEKESDGESVPTPLTPVVFDGISFTYDGNDDTVVTDVSMRIERGDFVAFVGPSGAGKSTIVSLLSRMYEPTDGEIRANGRPLGGLDLREWRSRVTVVRQQPYMFNDSLRFNITIGQRDATDTEFERACRLARVDEFAAELPEGYDTVLGDKGVRLSGGQRQRVAIARALLQEPEVLVLDEATSDLDTSLERDIQQELESLTEDLTLVVVAHRLSTIIDANRIYVMENGRITESGPHEELLDGRGTYAHLYHEQAR